MTNLIEILGKGPVVGLKSIDREMARRSPRGLAMALVPGFEGTVFHEAYYELLGAFAEGRIRRMMVSVPPQHGKSLGASVVLPAFLLGRDPNRRMAVVSYSFALARQFGRQVQRMMEDPEYGAVFPETRLKGAGRATPGERTARRTAQEFDCVGAEGGLRLVGRGGSLTGNRVDILVADDLYKDAMEANSPLTRERVWEWYNAVARTRLHNGSQELVVCTRWHEDDLAGRLMRTERVVDLTEWDGEDLIARGTWLRVNFEALMGAGPSRLDARGVGEALWPERHAEEGLLQRRRADPVLFEALYQGNPTSREGLLYGEFSTYTALPEGVLRRENYTDTADMGTDRLCSICYAVAMDGLCYVTEVLYSTEPMERTEGAVAAMLLRNGSRMALFESNNGGRGFARAVQRQISSLGAKGGSSDGRTGGTATSGRGAGASGDYRGRKGAAATSGRGAGASGDYRGRKGGAATAWGSSSGPCAVRMFHQKENKEARILTNATLVMEVVRMPEDWAIRWPEFATELRRFRRMFRTNAHDDGPDALTGMVESGLTEPMTGGRICHVGFGK